MFLKQMKTNVIIIERPITGPVRAQQNIFRGEMMVMMTIEELVVAAKREFANVTRGGKTVNRATNDV